MSRRPEAVRRMDHLRAAATIGHETIFGLHQTLLARDPTETRSLGLVAESARIVTVELPERLPPVRRSEQAWTAQSVLDPGAAAATAREMSAQARPPRSIRLRTPCLRRDR